MVEGDKVAVLQPQCRNCKHYRPTAIFELCMRAEATYSVAGKEDQHTVGHMRSTYLCNSNAVLFEPIA